MLRKFLMIAALGIASIFLPATAKAQSACANTVSVVVNVVDANSLAYYPATVTANISTSKAKCADKNGNSVPVSQVGPIATSSTGSVTFNLPNAANVTPSGTQWTFTIQTNGAPAPLGTGSQVCSVTQTVNSSSTISPSCPALSNVVGGTTLPLSGDVNGTVGASTVVGIEGNALSSNTGAIFDTAGTITFIPSVGGGSSGFLDITTNGNVSGDYVCWVLSVATECIPGLTPLPFTASGTLTALASTARGAYVKLASTTGAQTLPIPDGTTAGFGNNFYFQVCNHGTSGAASLTNNGGSFTFNGAASPYSLPEGYCAQISANSTNNGWAVEPSPGLLTAGTNITLTQTQYGTTIAATGGGSGTVTASPQYQLAYFPTSGTVATVQGSGNLVTDASNDLQVGLTSYTSAVTASPLFELNGSYENAATPTYAEDSWTVSNSIGAGLNGTSTLLWNHSGTTGALLFDLSNAGANKVGLTLGPTTNSTANIHGVQNIYGAGGANGSLSLVLGGNNTTITLYDATPSAMFSCTGQAATANENCTSAASFLATRVGGASLSVLQVQGAPANGGSATTTFPGLYYNVSGASAVTTFPTTGTMFGINTGSGFTGNLEGFYINGGAATYTVDYQGIETAAINQASTGTQALTGADYTNSTTGQTTVFSWTFPATAAVKTYHYDCNIMWESTNTTLVGPVFAVNISAAPTQLTANAYVSTALAGTYTTGYLSNTTTGSQTLITSAAAGVTNTNYPAHIWGTIEGSPTAGTTFLISAASTSSTTATLNIRRGSTCSLY